jgi:co-chaperonin GroES (HSP10)
VKKINIYAQDFTEEDAGNCRYPILCGEPELKVNGGVNGCGGEGGSTTAGKNASSIHRYMEQLKYYESTGVELPSGTEPTSSIANKNWSLDGIIVSPNTGEKYGSGVVVASGMTLGQNTHELIISNGDCVLTPTMSLICEIQYVELVRIGASSQIAKVQAM